MKKIQTPPFLNNLYRDMRDRRLLLPAVALVVALIAVPLALSSSSGTAAPPALSPAAGGSGHAAATSPAVLSEELGVTEYQKRLEQLNSKNPFRRQFVTVPKGAEQETSSGQTAATADTATTSSVPATTSAPTTSEAPSTSPSGTPPSSTPPSKPPKPTLYAFQADVAVGPPGDMTRRKSVELGKFLPGEGKPMVAFVGASEDLKHGLFLVSDDVSSVSGNGRCIPQPDNCKILRLKVGDQANLAYTPEGDRTYKLKLLGIGLAPVHAKAGDKHGKRASPSTLAAQG
jgi:hypothetical protein